MDKITLEYNVFDLPTAQHRAGLAGFLFLYGFLKGINAEPLPEVEEVSAYDFKITLTKDSLNTMFNELYQGEEIDVAKPDAKKKDIRLYPSGNFYKAYNMPEPWIKLWRDCIWKTLRAIPQTRNPYKERNKKLNTKEANKLWEELIKHSKAIRKGNKRETEISSSIYIGAMAQTAEIVPYKEEVPHIFLLHFWHIVTAIYQPEIVDTDGKSDFVGYAVAIPDICEIRFFIENYIEYLNSLGDSLRGYRPKDSIIGLPQQGALEFMLNMQKLIQQKSKRNLEGIISGVEVFHLMKRVNTVPILGTHRIGTSNSLLEEYDLIRRTYHNRIFQNQLIRNLLDNQEWYQNFDNVFSLLDAKLFVGSKAKYFINNVSTRFYACKQKGAKMKESSISLPLLILRLVQHYVWRKTEDKCGIKWDDFKNKKIKGENGKERVSVPKDYRDALEKVTMDAFLRIRSSKSHEEFVQFFTGTIASVPQFIMEDEFKQFTAILLDEEKWKEIKSITMLALSKTSYV